MFDIPSITSNNMIQKNKNKTEETRGFLHLPGSWLIEIWSKSCSKFLTAK